MFLNAVGIASEAWYFDDPFLKKRPYV